MSKRTPSGKVQPQTPDGDRRVAGGATGMRLLRGVLSRPMAVERRDGRLRVVLVERRRASSTPLRPSRPQLCGELRALLLADGHAEAPELMRHLAVVHDVLEAEGWRGVRALPAHVLAGAITQARILALEAPSPSLAFILERLGLIKAAADRREAGTPAAPQAEAVQVLETSYEEYEQTTRAWFGTVPSGLSPLDTKE